MPRGLQTESYFMSPKVPSAMAVTVKIIMYFSASFWGCFPLTVTRWTLADSNIEWKAVYFVKLCVPKPQHSLHNSRRGLLSAKLNNSFSFLE